VSVRCPSVRARADCWAPSFRREHAERPVAAFDEASLEASPILLSNGWGSVLGKRIAVGADIDSAVAIISGILRARGAKMVMFGIARHKAMSRIRGGSDRHRP